MPRLLKEMLIILFGVFATIYLMFPTLGVFELIPDAIPLVGSIDEAGATLILANVLNYYGINLTALFNRSEDKPQAKKKRIVRRVRRVPKQPEQPAEVIEDADYRELDSGKQE